MWIPLTTCVVALSLSLVLSLGVQGQKSKRGQRGTGRSESVGQNATPNRNSSSPSVQANGQAISTPSVAPATPTENGDVSPTPAASPTPEAKESFSQLTLFVFGSGIAFFIALLAWSDQIRGIDQDIRELETRFLERTGIEKQTFLRIVKPKSPDDRGEALLEVVSGGRIKNKDAAELLQIFTKWHKQWSWIESLASAKYYATIALTFLLFLVGFASLFTKPTMHLLILSMKWNVEMLVLIPPGTLVVSLLIIIICIAERERALRSLLKSVSDMV
jgi:hypothetical protein